ncbi:carbon monoxide dehydrogenase [Sulfolobales archaeon HS-7]|nr:carbon monoxide dehydrogenase [Sulfolobales archaeon HS-7]
MYPPKFGYVIPESMDEVLEFLEKEQDARPLAGGHSLIPMLKLRIIRPSYLVNIRGLKELHFVNDGKDTVSIGALVTHFELNTNDIINKNVPLLSEAASVVADPQVRNMGTIGGVVSNSDPAADYPASLIALDAIVRIRNRGGVRDVPFSSFQKDVFTTDLKQGELVQEIVIPKLPAYKYRYRKLERRAGDYAIVGVAVLIKMNGEEIEDVRIGLTSVGPKAIRAKEAEELLKGNKPSDELLDKAGEEAMKVSNPTADIRGSVEYKKKMVKVMTKRALKEALER